MSSARPLFRFTVTFRDMAGDHDSEQIWAESHNAAVDVIWTRPDTGAMAIAFGNHVCGPDDWDRVRLPDGRELSRADYMERETHA